MGVTLDLVLKILVYPHITLKLEFPYLYCTFIIVWCDFLSNLGVDRPTQVILPKNYYCQRRLTLNMLVSNLSHQPNLTKDFVKFYTTTLKDGYASPV